MVKNLKDRLGKTLKVGDRVAFSSYKNLGLTVGKINKLGRIRAEVYCDGDLDTVADWLTNGWAESIETIHLVKVTS